MKIKEALKKICMSIIPVLIFCPSLMCQDNVGSGRSLTNAAKTTAVNSISTLLFDNYIFPEVSKKMEDLIKTRLDAGEYDKISDPVKFAEELTKDLQSVSKDKHIRVQYNPDQIKRMKDRGDKDDEAEFLQQMKSENYGFKKVEILSGNIGYIDFRAFGPGEYIREKVEDVMGYVEDCDALIFDMRYNGGGDPTGVQVISSYLFGEEPVHLNDLYFRPKDTTEQFWTLKDIKGKRMPDVPVYVLTSSSTFSGAEEFTYNLKNLKRATIVGETTGGGAHPGGMNIVDDNFSIFVPNGRAINPITKTNWEGTGVSPDVEINSINALTKAHILALETLAKNSSNENRPSEWMIESLNATLNNVEVDNSLLKSYAGNYNDRKVYYENGKLYYQRNGRQKFELTPMSEDTFMIKEVSYFRVKFVKDSSGKVSQIIGLYDDGKTDSSDRTD
ncbi:MAG: S41 family peptidase [bacterium]